MKSDDGEVGIVAAVISRTDDEDLAVVIECNALCPVLAIDVDGGESVGSEFGDEGSVGIELGDEEVLAAVASSDGEDGAVIELERRAYCVCSTGE